MKRAHRILLVLGMLLSSAQLVFAQHEHHMMDTTSMDSMESMDMDDEMIMTHSLSRNLPMNRNGSGTSWMPDNTPIYGYMLMGGKWNFMFHGSIFLRYNNQDVLNKGSRGGKKIDAPNWFMGMAQREIGQRGLLNFNMMLSADAFTVGGAGYPLLFQSGESWNGQPLVDKQHPHDLFSELSVSYTHMLNKDMDVYGYFGYPGEPSIGPPAFMHRISAFNNPDAPLGHHWQDATHITFGVGTLGFRYKIIKLEGSVFTGREPNENRYNFDQMRFNSYSGRISVNPNAYLSFQVSHAFIKSPEALFPDVNIRRTTASMIHSLPFGDNNYLTSSLVWGMNNDGDHNEHTLLLESNLQLNNTGIYGKYELVQKSAHELAIPQFDDETLFTIHALTFGVSETILKTHATNLSIGIQGSIFNPDPSLKPIYGDAPASVEVYMHVTPGLLRMNNKNH